MKTLKAAGNRDAAVTPEANNGLAIFEADHLCVLLSDLEADRCPSAPPLRPTSAFRQPYPSRAEVGFGFTKTSAPTTVKRDSIGCILAGFSIRLLPAPPSYFVPLPPATWLILM